MIQTRSLGLEMALETLAQCSSTSARRSITAMLVMRAQGWSTFCATIKLFFCLSVMDILLWILKRSRRSNLTSRQGGQTIDQIMPYQLHAKIFSFFREMLIILHFLQIQFQLMLQVQL